MARIGKDGGAGVARAGGVTVLAFGLLLGVAPLGAIATAGGAFAETPATVATDPAVARLAETMQLDRVLDVMRAEGLDYAETLAEDMFPGRGGPSWQAEVGKIYDQTRMQSEFLTAFSVALAGDPALPEAQVFITSDLGQKVISLEIAAREAMLDEAAEDAARVSWLEIEEAGQKRLRLIEEFAQVNDLMESNVTGAMNANLAFYRGLMKSAPAGMAMAEGDILAAVAEQEEQIRAETGDWLFPYLTLAYQPLSDDELQAYVDFSGSAPGQALNSALFAAFAVVFDRLSHDLGAATGMRMQGQDI